MAQNEALTCMNSISQASRNSEYNGTPLSDVLGDGSYDDPYLGCNAAGANAPGIGIATANGQCKRDDWTVFDQKNAARSAQKSQHIGGDGLGKGNQTAHPLIVFDVADTNDTVTLAVLATGWVRDTVA